MHATYSLPTKVLMLKLDVRDNPYVSAALSKGAVLEFYTCDCHVDFGASQNVDCKRVVFVRNKSSDLDDSKAAYLKW